jgi:beta-lactamase class C
MLGNQGKKLLLFTVLLILLIIAIGFSLRNKVKPVQTGISNEEVIPDTSPQRKLIDNYASFIANAFDSTHTVGAAVAIVFNGKIMLMNTYGVKVTGTMDSVDRHTVFRLASVSKGFAGVLACKLEQDRLLSLDENISEIIPGFRLRDSVNTRDLSIRNILSHTTGLVPHAFDNLIEDGVSFPLVFQELPMVEISAKPGVLYSYQNVIFSLLDSIIFIKTGLQYDVLLRKKLFKPLNMRDASANPDIFKRRKGNVAHPHVLRDSLPVLLPVNTGYYNLKPAAGVNASISDMSKWLLALLGNRPDIMDSSLLRLIETPVVESPLKRSYLKHWDHIDAKYYSLGWRIYYYKGREIVYHGGYVTGYRSEIAYCPEEKVGIVFLENSPNELASVSVPEFFNRWFASEDTLTKN